ncbi:cms1 ribosomal small subunit [Irineochytrium annulatum]|nr:cms1 ribosomal small subunit [Irineochytrium annulatum]
MSADDLEGNFVLDDDPGNDISADALEGEILEGDAVADEKPQTKKRKQPTTAGNGAESAQKKAKKKQKPAKTLELRSTALAKFGLDIADFPESGEDTITDYVKDTTLRGKKIIIVTASAERAIFLNPKLKPFGTVAKLFARHMKLKEQIENLRSKNFQICIGTPNRLARLVSEDALKVESFACLLVDAAIDQKARSIAEIAELTDDLKALFKLCRDNNVDIVLK